MNPKNHNLKIASDVVFIADKFDTEKPSQHTILQSTFPLLGDEVGELGVPKPEQSKLDDSSEPSTDSEKGNETLESAGEPVTSDSESVQSEGVLIDDKENIRRYPIRNASKPKRYTS